MLSRLLFSASANSIRFRAKLSETIMKSSSTSTAKSGSSDAAAAAASLSTSIDDNPCWGGPEPNRHDLEYLLRVLGATPGSQDTSRAADTDTSLSSSNANQQKIITDCTSSPPPLDLSSNEERSAWIQRIHKKLILYQDENYLAIHKPADLRMDGPHRATVHKLLLYLFPPPSLLDMISEKNNEMEMELEAKEEDATKTNNDEEAKLKHRHNQLLKSIAPLAKHSYLKDDPHRMVHQLDYATSGVLLVGKNRKSTGVASQSFEDRRTNKQYVAVVINNDPLSSSSSSVNNATPDNNTTNNYNIDNPPSLSPPLGPNFLKSLPTIPSSSLTPWKDGSLEKRYRKKRQRDNDERPSKRGTFDGYMPIHSVFDKWRAVLVRERKEQQQRRQQQQQQQQQQQNNEVTSAEDKDKTKGKKRRRNNYLPPLPAPTIPLTSQDIDHLLSLPPSWKGVKKSCIANRNEDNNGFWNNLNTIVGTMTREYNVSLKEYYAKKNTTVVVGVGGGGGGGGEEQGNGKRNRNENNGNTATRLDVASLPPLFRIGDSSSSNSKDDVKGQDGDLNSFYICASIGEPKDGRFVVVVDPSTVKNKPPKGSSTPLPELRPSLTKCTVLWRGYMDSSDGAAEEDGSVGQGRQRVPVAKVLLQPWTGRRHQLRVHLAQVAGCPILGDVAYGGSLTAETNNDVSEERSAVCRRMCLHAYQLSVPLMGGQTKTFVAPDPFATVKKKKEENDGGGEEEEMMVIL